MPRSDRGRATRSAARQAVVAAAARARERALAGYSRFQVGAALETLDGAVIAGCNIENASYGLTMCAERVALFKALSEGHRRFRSLAVVTGAAEPTPPCGACRQLLWEFCGDIEVRAVNLEGIERRWRLRALLPGPFDSSSLEEKTIRARAGRASPDAKRRSPNRARRQPSS